MTTVDNRHVQICACRCDNRRRNAVNFLAIRITWFRVQIWTMFLVILLSLSRFITCEQMFLWNEDKKFLFLFVYPTFYFLNSIHTHSHLVTHFLISRISLYRLHIHHDIKFWTFKLLPISDHIMLPNDALTSSTVRIATSLFFHNCPCFNVFERMGICLAKLVAYW